MDSKSVASADEYGIITANPSNFWRSGARRRNLHMLRTKIIKQGGGVDSFGTRRSSSSDIR